MNLKRRSFIATLLGLIFVKPVAKAVVPVETTGAVDAILGKAMGGRRTATEVEYMLRKQLMHGYNYSMTHKRMVEVMDANFNRVR